MTTYKNECNSDSDVPELEETLYRQIKNFKPINQLKNSVNKNEISDGVVLEFDEGTQTANDENMDYNGKGYSNPFDLYEDSEDEDDIGNSSMPTKVEDITGDGGVVKISIKPGKGCKPCQNSLCRIIYSAFLNESTIPFDSTNYQSNHTMVKIGEEGNTILGLQHALESMLKGEKSKFIIQPEYAYGLLGCPPRIPANATITYVIEMINFVDQSANDLEEGETEHDRNSWKNVVKKLTQLRNEANDLFENNQIRRALRVYAKALRLVNNADLYSDKDEQEMKEASIKINNNIGLCGMQLNKFKYSILALNRVLELDPHNAKAIYRLGKVYRLKGDYDQSQKYLLQARSMLQHNNDVRNELLLLSQNLKEYNEANRLMCQNIFNQDSTRQRAETEEQEYKRIKANIDNIDLAVQESIDAELIKFINDDGLKKLSISNLFEAHELEIIKILTEKYSLKLTIKNHVIVIEKITDL